jgi:hypothetical protein
MENANNSFIVVAPQDGSTVSVVGDIYRIIIGSEQTDGAYALIDMLIPLKGGPLPHSHVTFQEAFYIIIRWRDYSNNKGKNIHSYKRLIRKYTLQWTDTQIYQQNR